MLTFDQVQIKKGEIQHEFIELINQLDVEKEYLTKGAYFLIQ